MTTAVVVVVWNGERYLSDCLRCIAEQTEPPHEIVVIDNASEDGSNEIAASFAARIGQRGAAVTVLRQSRNLGFTCGANQGLKAVLESPTAVDCVVLLNQDALIEPTWCETVSAALDADGRIGIVGSKLLLPDRLRLQHAGGYLERPRLVGRHFGHYCPDGAPTFNEPREVDFVTAAAMAVRSAALREVGLFDEIFSPGYYEDVDLCDRLRIAGWKIVYRPDAVGIHAESTAFGSPVARLALSHKSRLIYALPWLARPSFAQEFCSAERLYIERELGANERRALSAAYLRVLLMGRRAIKARIDQNLFSADLMASLIQMFAGLRHEIAASWADLDNQTAHVTISE